MCKYDPTFLGIPKPKEGFLEPLPLVQENSVIHMDVRVDGLPVIVDKPVGKALTSCIQWCIYINDTLGGDPGCFHSWGKFITHLADQSCESFIRHGVKLRR